MNTQSIDDFLTQAFENGGDLTPEQAAQLLQMGDTPGDTGASASEPSNVPDVAPAQIEGQAVPEGEKTATPDESGLTAENAVILAKDGKHTISYDKLVQAREAAQTAQAAQQAMAAQLEAANQKLVELQAQAQARAEAGQAPTQADTNAAAAQAAIDAGVDPALFGDFSPEAMAKGVAQLVQAQLDARMAAIDAKLQPIQQQTARSATEVHLSAIYSAHPDADSIVESREFAAWKSTQPGVVRAALDAALDVLQDQVALHWVHSADGLGRVEQVPLKDGRPQTPRLELAFDTMGVMRRNLINRRRSHASRTTS